MKYKEQKEWVEGLRALADFFEAHIEVPAPYSVNIYTSIRKFDENGNLDEAAVKDTMVELARAMKPVEKRYDSTDFNLIKTFSSKVKLSYYCDREVACTKVVTGTREVEEVIYVPPVKTGKTVTEETFEWQCDPLLS